MLFINHFYYSNYYDYNLEILYPLKSIIAKYSESKIKNSFRSTWQQRTINWGGGCSRITVACQSCGRWAGEWDHLWLQSPHLCVRATLSSVCLCDTLGNNSTNLRVLTLNWFFFPFTLLKGGNCHWWQDIETFSLRERTSLK